MVPLTNGETPLSARHVARESPGISLDVDVGAAVRLAGWLASWLAGATFGS